MLASLPFKVVTTRLQLDINVDELLQNRGIDECYIFVLSSALSSGVPDDSIFANVISPFRRMSSLTG
jgi:hypothetical protein